MSPAMLRTQAHEANRGLDRLFSCGPVLCDGAMGTMLLGRGISIERCYDELNLSQPETVASIHAEYLEAGAQMVETNTFGANAFRLSRHGLANRVREINLAGASVARLCVDREKPLSPAFVAGAVGPLGVPVEPFGAVGLDQAQSAFSEQITALAQGGPGLGVDLLVVETMTSLGEATAAVRAARESAPELPLVVMMTVDQDGNCLDGASPELAAAHLTELGADAVGCNCSDGPVGVLRAIARMRAATHLPLAAMPNAGMPRRVGGRNVYLVSPEYIAGFTGRLVQAGASLLGGCCGTTPDHTRAMNSALRALYAGDSTAQTQEKAALQPALPKHM